MTDRVATPPERRRHPRIAPKGTVVLHVQGNETHARIANVSEGGIYVHTNVTAPERMLGRDIQIEIRLDGGHAQWLRTIARIVRIRADGMALSFVETPPAPLLHMIDELGTASRARSRIISVVLIDSDVNRRTAMALGFRSTGCVVVEASTPLEAIVRLGESTFEPDVIAVADSHPAAAADEIRSFVDHHHPHVRIITIGDETLAREGNATWLSSANPDDDLVERVREALVQPRRRRL